MPPSVHLFRSTGQFRSVIPLLNTSFYLNARSIRHKKQAVCIYLPSNLYLELSRNPQRGAPSSVAPIHNDSTAHLSRCFLLIRYGHPGFLLQSRIVFHSTLYMLGGSMVSAKAVAIRSTYLIDGRADWLDHVD